MKKLLPTIVVAVLIILLFFVIFFRLRDRKVEPIPTEMPMHEMVMPGMMEHGGAGNTFLPDLRIDPVDGGVTIGDLYQNAADYQGKEILVKGQITKIVRAVMGKNWVHMQDGSQSDGKFDLTITTQDSVAVGDVALFKGILATDKDFGTGFFYEIILEEAALQNQ